MNDIPIVENLLALNILMFDVDIVDGNNVGELGTQNVHKNEFTVRLLKTTTIYAARTTLMQSSDLFAALNVTLF